MTDDGLREMVAALIHRHKLKGSDAVAGMILALPEIAEALAFTDKFRASGYNVTTSPSVK